MPATSAARIPKMINKVFCILEKLAAMDLGRICRVSLDLWSWKEREKLDCSGGFAFLKHGRPNRLIVRMP